MQVGDEVRLHGYTNLPGEQIIVRRLPGEDRFPFTRCFHIEFVGGPDDGMLGYANPEEIAKVTG